MSKLLYEWLNDLQLSRSVYSLEDDFRDGFLLGDLLFRHNQQPDFSKFINADSPDARINNFCLLEPTMRAIGVHFNSKSASDIMNSKPGATKTLLYELKTALDRIKKNSQLASSTYKGNQPTKITRIVPPIRPAFDMTKAVTFENAIRSMVDNPNDIMMDRTVERFQDKKGQFRDSVSMSHSDLVSALQSERLRMRDISRQKRQHEQVFTKAWDSLGQDQWKKNQKTAHDRREMHKNFMETTKSFVETKRDGIRKDICNATLKSIEDFDRRQDLEIFPQDPEIDDLTAMNGGSTSNSIQRVVAGIPGSGAPDLTFLNEDYMASGLQQAQKTMKEHVDNAQLRQKTHDIRRRRFIRVREADKAKMLQSSLEEDILSQVASLSHFETIEDISCKRIMSQKFVIDQNRVNREALINEFNQETQQIESTWKGEVAKREYDWHACTRMDSQSERVTILADAVIYSQTKDMGVFIVSIIDRIIDSADWVASARSLGRFSTESKTNDKSIDKTNEKLLPDLLWGDVTKLFLSPLLPVAAALPYATQKQIHDALPYSLSERPHCCDMTWLLKQPFQTHITLPGPSTSIDQPSIQDSSVGLVICPRDSFPIPDERTISEYLASFDMQDFSRDIANVNIFNFGFDEIPEFSPQPASSTSESTVMIPSEYSMVSPQWVFEVAPKYLLGEAVMAVSSISDPIPPDPCTPLGIPSLALRMAVSGLSETTKLALATAIQSQIPGIIIIDTESLLEASIKLATASDDNDHSNEGEDIDARNSLPLALAKEVLTNIQAGKSVPDSLYVDLIIQEIRSLNNNNKNNNNNNNGNNDSCVGFMLVDFPNTKTQALLLIEALSGLNFDAHKPQLLDRQSIYAAPKPREEQQYDMHKCGLDLVVYFNDEIAHMITEGSCARKNLFTEDIVQLTAETALVSVEGLQEVLKLSRPQHTTGLAAYGNQSCESDLKAFLSRMSLLMEVKATDFESQDQAINNTIDLIKETYFPPLEIIISNEENSPDFGITVSQVENINPQEIEPLVQDIAKEEEPKVIELPEPLTKILSSIWKHTESLSTHAGRTCLNALRDIRYEMMQRRRGVVDVISNMLVRSDDRKNIFEQFRQAFNEVEDDFRYDIDCTAELHLRTFELGNSIWELCDARKKEADEMLDKVRLDGVLDLHKHRSHCEAAAFIQSEIDRFYISLHLLFDFSKSISSYDRRVLVANPLEETLPMAVPKDISALLGDATAGAAGKAGGKDGKGKDTKAAAPAAGKDAKKGGGKGEVIITAVPFREPVSPILLPIQSMRSIPDPPVAEQPDGTADKSSKGKAPPKAAVKKGAEEVVVLNPLDAMLKSALACIDTWSKGTFTVQRIVYLGNENMAMAIEKAVWHEAERLKFSVLKVKDFAEAQVNWLIDCESSIIDISKADIKSRHEKEISCCQRLVDMIGDVVRASEPIREDWLLAPDVIALTPSRLIVPYPQPPPIPHVQVFYSDKLNEEQSEVLKEWVNALKSTDSNVMVEDLDALFDRCTSRIGPRSSIDCSGELMKTLTLPMEWRTRPGPTDGELQAITSDIRNEIRSNQAALGIEGDEVGIIPVTNVLRRLLGDE